MTGITMDVSTQSLDSPTEKQAVVEDRDYIRSIYLF
jgi:hypothetical protein